MQRDILIYKMKGFLWPLSVINYYFLTLCINLRNIYEMTAVLHAFC